jgi:hypothetical protein
MWFPIIIVRQEELLINNININIIDMKKYMLILFYFKNPCWWVEERNEMIRFSYNPSHFN